MKTNLLKAAIALLGAGCILATSCLQNQETVKPVFPENKVQKTVVAGESVDIVFEANLDWELSLSGDGVMSYFWIDDAGTKESKIKGSAGSQTVTVRFSEENELDTNRKCIVTLTMGGESCEIAEIDRLMIARTVVIKVAEHWETAFKKDDGKYVYADIEEGASLKFISFPEELDYALPIKVQSNFDWELALPEWVESSVANGKAGDTEVYLTAVISESIKNGETGKLNFVDASNQEAKIEVEISIDSFADRVEFTGKNFDFNAAGQIKSAMGEYMDGSGYFTVLAAKEAVVRVLGFDGNYHDTDFATWVTVVETGSEGEEFLSKRSFSIKAKANDGDARVADILVLPASMAELGPEELCVSADGCPFTEAVKPYVFGRISQLASEAGPVEGQGVLSIDPDYDTCDAKLTFLEDSWLKYEFETDQFYELLYTGEYSDTRILSGTPIVTAQVLNFDLEPVGEDEAFWASTWVSSDGRQLKLNTDLDSYQRVGSEDEELVPECFIALLDADGNYIAVIDFKYDLGGSIPEGEPVTLEGDYGTIENLAGSDLYSFISSEYSVTDVYGIDVNVANAVIKLAKAPDAVDVYSFDMDSGATEADERLYFEGGMNNTFTCYIDKSVTETTTWLIVFKSNGVNYLAVLFTYNPESAGAYVSFAYPDYVQNATLGMYTGDLLETILSEQYGLTADAVYCLKYTGDPTMAQLNVPGEPEGQAAWYYWDWEEAGNPDALYWLTYEIVGKTMTVLMTEAGKEDYFLWKDSNGMPLCVLVCTAEIN